MKAYKCRPGEIIVVKSSGSVSNVVTGKAALVTQEMPTFSFSNFLLRVIPSQVVWDSRFLYAFLTSHMVRKRIELMVSGTTYPNLKVSEYRGFEVPLPNRPEQRAIANFLDRETAKIDALVEKKERLIELLKEKRTALISHAVTKGLDPNVPIKDSGIEWLGQIPAHWHTGKVRMFSQQVTDGAHISPDTTSPDYPFISTVNIVGGRIDFENCLGTTSETYAYMEQTGCRPRRGDVLFSKDGTVGRTTVVDTDAEFVVASSLVIISPRKETVLPRYLEYWLNGAFVQELVQLYLSGAALRRISVAKVGNLPIALPSLNEQRTIADFIDRETAKIDALIEKIKKAIELLKEYRTALISAAVTGKIDVRDGGEEEQSLRPKRQD